VIWTVFDHLFGIHRIQRVPNSESKGRRHTSTVIVARADDTGPEQIELDLNEVDLINYRGSGNGGQHRNKNDTCVRATHRPTGTVAFSEDHKSQYRNRMQALERLRLKLQQEVDQAHAQQRSDARIDNFRGGRAWVWTDWRDEVKSPSGKKMSMSKALKGKFQKLLG
jgi:protein subunit release factor A